MNRELQTTEKLTVDLKEFQNKTIHVETLESVVRVKDKVLKNLKLSHDKFNEKLEERTCNLRPNTKSTDKLEKFILVNLSEPYKEPLILSDPQGFDPYLHQKAPKSVLLFTQESLTKFSFAL